MLHVSTARSAEANAAPSAKLINHVVVDMPDVADVVHDGIDEPAAFERVQCRDRRVGRHSERVPDETGGNGAALVTSGFSSQKVGDPTDQFGVRTLWHGSEPRTERPPSAAGSRSRAHCCGPRPASVRC